MDANLREWKKGNNSVYSQSLKKWLGTIEVPKKYIPLWLLYPFLVTIGIIIIAILWVITLRNQITERRKVQEALLDSENRFQSLSDAAFEGILITEKGNILDANSTLAKMFDYSAEELVGMKADALAAKDAREEVQDKILSGYEKPYEILGLKKDGSTFPIEAQAKMFTYKGRQVRVTAIRDLTEQKKAEEEIKTLIGILPICSFCKNIRNDEGYYQQIEEYIHEHSGVDFSHTVCPDCMKKHYPEYDM